MKIVWFSWKDINHPFAGGAELVSWQLMKRLANDGHQVRLITCRYSKSDAIETIDGVEIHRVGNKYTVYLKAFWYFRRQMSSWPELTIDEMNTIPFGAGLYSNCRSVLLTYQLARQVWFYQMNQPFSTIGYLVEPLYLRFIKRFYDLVITESESTRQDLIRHSYDSRKVKVFRIGTDLKPIEKLPEKTDVSNILILGAIRPMKRTLLAIQGFESAKEQQPALRLTVAGDDSGQYAEQVKKYVHQSLYQSSITFTGRVTAAERISLMRKASIILVTSVKEGWGLIVTEANSQGTPAIAFDCDGLRDSVKDKKTGLLVKAGDVHKLGTSITTLLADSDNYQKLRHLAWEDSKQYTFENCYADFLQAANIYR